MQKDEGKFYVYAIVFNIKSDYDVDNQNAHGSIVAIAVSDGILAVVCYIFGI